VARKDWQKQVSTIPSVRKHDIGRVYFITVKKTCEFSEYGSEMNMPSGNGSNLAYRAKYPVVFKILHQCDIEYTIKLNFAVRSKIAQLKETEGSNVIATSSKEDESCQSTPSPVARSMSIFSPAPVSIALLLLL
jgi:hypothetical protein